MKKTKNEKITYSIVFGLFVLYAIFILYFFAFGLNISLKESQDVYAADMVSLSWPANFKNYLEAFETLTIFETSYFGMIINSVWYAIGGTFLGLMSSACCAYVVAKYDFIGKKTLYFISIMVMLVPVYGALPAKYTMFYDMGIMDSPLFLVCMAGGFGYSFLLMYSFFASMSWSYAEAAFIDGANDFAVFFKIMIPMVVPSMMAVFIMNFIGLWNDYETPLVFLRYMPTIASGIYVYEQNMAYGGSYPVYFAGVILSLIPIFTLFAVAQNTIMQNIYAGGLKG